MSAVITVENLTRRFGNFTAVDHINFEIEPGEVVGYLGPNGSGKTTTIRMLLGILHPSEGHAEVLGYDVTRQSELIRAQSGYMSQKFALYQELTVWENLEFYAGVYGVSDVHRLHTVLENLGLKELESHLVSSFSSGWRQRLSLGVALIHEPRLLFLDEPTSGVDPVARRAFWDLIYTLVSDRVSVLVTTHYMDEAEYCGRVGIMRQGKLSVMDAPHRLKRSLTGRVWEVYAEPLLPALNTLIGFTEVEHASLASDHLRAVLKSDASPTHVKRALSGAGIRVSRIMPADVSMEDVFFTLV